MDDSVGRGKRIISLDSSDMMIEALVPEKNSSDKFHAIAFKASAIDYVMDVNEKVSALVLKNSIVIPVAYPFQKLKQIIYAPDFRDDRDDAGNIDLTSVTGKIVGDTLLPSLADAFNTAKKGLILRAILRQDGTNRTAVLDFPEEAIAFYETEEDSQAKEGYSVAIHFNKQSGVTLPFGGTKAMLDMPHEDFIAHLSSAKTRNAELLDFCSIFAGNRNKYGFDPD